MAKKLVQSYYTYTASTNVLVVDQFVKLEELLVITNLTRNQIVYNFASTSKGATVSFDATTEKTSITLDFTATGAADSDKFQIFIDVPETVIDISDSLLDPVHKLRVSTPQNLIDTDFEYGLQPTKWETVELSNNIPSFYTDDGDGYISDIQSVTTTSGTSEVVITTSASHGLAVGTPIDVRGLSSRTAEGKFLIKFVTDTTITYQASGNQTVTGDISGVYTTIAPGSFFQSSQITYTGSTGITTDSAVPSDITVTTENPHGFEVNSNFYLTNTVANKIVTIDSGTSTSSTASDNFEVVEPDNTIPFSSSLDLTQTETKEYVPAYHTKIVASDVNIVSNSITWTAHDLRDDDCLLYVKPSGDTGIGGLNSMGIYYVIVVDANTIQLSTTYGGTSVALSSTGTYTYGRGMLGLVYELRQYYLRGPYRQTYARTRYFVNGRTTGSGWDLGVVASGNATYGKANVGDYNYYNKSLFMSPSNTNLYQLGYGYIGRYGYYFSTSWDANIVQPDNNTIPDARNFVEDFGRFGISTVTYSTNANSGYVYGTNGEIYVYHGVYYGSYPTYTQGTSQFWVPLIKDPEADTLFIQNHGLETGQSATLTTNSGTDVKYQTGTVTRTGVLTSPASVKISKITNDRFRLNNGTTDYRIYDVTGTYTLSGNKDNAFKNSFFISNHDLTTGQRITLDTPGSGVLPTTADTEVTVDGDVSTVAAFDIINNYITNNMVGGVTPVSYNVPTLDQMTDTRTVMPAQTLSAAQNGAAFTNNMTLYDTVSNTSTGQNTNTRLEPDKMSQVGGYQPFANDNVHAGKLITAVGTDLINNTTVPYYFYVIGGDWEDYATTSTYTNFRQYSPRITWSTDPTRSNWANDQQNAYTGSNNNWYWTAGHAELQRSDNNLLFLTFKIRPRYLSDTQSDVSSSHIFSTGANYAEGYNSGTRTYAGDLLGGFIVQYDDATSLTSTQVIPFMEGIVGALDANWRTPALNETDLFTVNNLSTNRFSLSKNGIPVDITNNGTSPITFTTEATGGIADGGYTADAVTTNSFTLPSGSQITPVTYDFDSTTIDTALDAIVFTTSTHYQTGSTVVYSNNGNTDISGLTDGYTYYTVPITDKYIKLASSLSDAQAGNVIDLTATGTGTHQLQSQQISGLVETVGTCNLVVGEKTVVGTNTLFKRFFKVNDPITFLIGSAPGEYYTTTITAIATDTQLEIQDATTVADATAKAFTTTKVYARPDGYAVHRPYDGGVEIAAGTAPYSQIIRQTRKYFRYQSGKGIQTSLALNFNPPVIIETLTSSSTTATATTRYPHRLSTGQSIKVKDASDTVYNGTFDITKVDEFTFTYTLPSTPTTTNPSGIIKYNVNGYSGAAVRSGMFDQQNGFFFEYDGSTLYAVRRSTTTQLSGIVSATKGSNRIVGTNTNFTGQLTAGDFIVIRGLSFRVTSISSNTLLYIQPEYIGESGTDVIVTKTEDLKVPQTEWNLDKADGQGPYGFNLDIDKIQMAYMDYSWYGAGKIRFGFKDIRGHVRYCHEFLHNNRLDEAYMRSGNLPGKYEIINSANPTYAPTLFHWGTSIIMDGRFDEDEAYLFTATSDNLSFTAGQSNTSTTNATSSIRRQKVFGNFSYYYLQLKFPTADASKFTVGAILTTGTNALGIYEGSKVESTFYSGSSFVVEIFLTSGYSTPNISVPTSTVVTIGGSAAEADVNLGIDLIPLVSLRLSPSVDSNLPGNLGQRDIINRMQLKLNEVGVILSHDCEVVLILNGNLSNTNYVQVGSPSLSQLIKHEIGEIISGGAEVFSFRAAGGVTDNNGVNSSNASDFTLQQVIDLGNAILGGDGTFPNGPDVLSVAVRILDTTTVSSTNPFNASGRITWSESQA